VVLEVEDQAERGYAVRRRGQGVKDEGPHSHLNCNGGGTLSKGDKRVAPGLRNSHEHTFSLERRGGGCGKKRGDKAGGKEKRPAICVIGSVQFDLYWLLVESRAGKRPRLSYTCLSIIL